jgi:hypothetical protein
MGSSHLRYELQLPITLQEGYMHDECTAQRQRRIPHLGATQAHTICQSTHVDKSSP